MGTIINTVLLGSIVLFWIGVFLVNIIGDPMSTWEDVLQGVGATLVFIAILGAILAVIASFITKKVQVDQYDVYEAEIFTLKTETIYAGRFVLGSGYYNGRTYYMFYKKAESGEFYMEKVNESDTFIIESDFLPLGLYKRIYEYEYSTFGLKKTKQERGERNYVIVVPTNTIIIPLGG